MPYLYKMYCPSIIQFSQYDIFLSALIINILWYTVWGTHSGENS